MSRNTRPAWYEDDNPDRVGRALAGRAALYIVAAVIFVGLIGAAGWGVKVLLSPAKGAGDAVMQRESANNRISAQERFEDLYAEIVAADQKITVFAAAAKADPKSQVAQTNLIGAQTYCLEVIGDYNAEARKFTSEQFRAVDLPAQIDTLNPATDCEATP